MWEAVVFEFLFTWFGAPWFGFLGALKVAVQEYGIRMQWDVTIWQVPELAVAGMQMSTNSTLNGNVEMSTANGFNSGIITNPLQVPGVCWLNTYPQHQYETLQSILLHVGLSMISHWMGTVCSPCQCHQNVHLQPLLLTPSVAPEP